MLITKLAMDSDRFRRRLYFFPNARTAFKGYIRALRFAASENVLLPAYIGWSPREGSGVFDPVKETGVGFLFYPLDNKLHIDVRKLEDIFRKKRVKLFVIIHYFGYVDPNYSRIVHMARKYGARVLEDEAHSLYSNFFGGISGRLGDASIFSLHKMLPLAGGGALSLNNDPGCPIRAKSSPVSAAELLSYDLFSIAVARRRNAEELSKHLVGSPEYAEPLRPVLAHGEVPQTYPVAIKGVSRDLVYERMNAAGYGVVSLYHAMIPQVDLAAFPDSHSVSRQILNLPVHQDVPPSKLASMVKKLIKIIKGLKS